MKRILLSALLIALVQGIAFSQLTVTTNTTATALAQQITGSGVTITNAALNCGSQASGTYTYSGPDLGLTNGVLLTTGVATQVMNPNGSTFLNFTNGNNFTDPDLIAISPKATFDVCILQFDFVPICDTMRIKYVFGSDEYPKYINQFNDAFGVFLTGPNPAGGSYAAQNIATVPSTTTPVEINTVNGGWPLGTGATNPADYVDNYPPDGTNTHNFDYYGYTIPLSSATPVVACSSYHMKIAVADAVNANNDSGVFIQGGSVTCNTGLPTTAATGVASATCGSHATAYATVTGYVGTPTYSWSPGGMTTDTIKNLGAGTYTCTIGFQSTCGAPYSQTVSVTITQPVALTSIGASTAASCGGNTGTATAKPQGGTPAYTYSWKPGGATTSSISGLPAGTDTCFITDAQGCQTSIGLTVASSGSLTSTSTPVGPTCNLANGSIATTVAGGTGNYTYSWSPSGGNASSALNLPAGTYTCYILDASGCSKNDTVTLTNVGALPVITLVPTGSPSFCQGKSIVLTASGGGTYSWSTGAVLDSVVVTAPGNYQVVVANSCGKDSLSEQVSMTPLPVATVAGGGTVCPGDSLTLQASGGTTGITYSWSPTGATTSAIHASASGSYTVTATNTCGSSSASATVTLDVVHAQYSTDSTMGYAPFAVAFTNTSSSNATNFSWNFGDGATGNGANTTHTYTTPGTYTALLTVTDGQGCKSIYSEVIVVHEEPSWVMVPNVFTPNGDGSNESFSIKSQGLESFDMKIYDRWGVLMSDFSNPTQGWDGRNKSGVLVSAGTYFYIMAAKGLDGKTYNKEGFLTLFH